MRLSSVLVLASIFLLSSCGMKSPPSVEVPTDSTTPMPTTSYTEVISSASSKIKDTPEFEACMKPNVDMCINMVGNQLAQAKKSVEFCDELTQVESKEACKYGIIISQSSEQKNIALCDTLSPTYKKECRISYLSSEASTSGDITKCDALKAEMTESQSGINMPIGGFDRSEQCRMDIIVRKPDLKESDCDILSNNTKDMCLSMVKNSRNLPDLQ